MQKEFVVLDVETTGLNPQWDRIIQVAMLREAGREVERLAFFVNPGRLVPDFVRRLTGFGDMDFGQYPDVAAIRGDIANFIGDRTIVGHNVSFDLGFLQEAGFFYDKFVDTLEWARIALPTESSYRLENLSAADSGFHDARNDVEATYHLLGRIREALGRFPQETQRDLRFLLGDEWAWWAPEESMPAASPSPLDHPIAEQPVAGELPRVPHTVLAGEWLGKDSALGRSFVDFEKRPAQDTMLAAVERAYDDESILMVEAGTGTGKSLAYLAPALLASLRRGERTVIATYTLALQEQLWNKDLPMAQQDLPVRTAMVKGRGQYICLLKTDELRQTVTVLNESREKRLALARLLTFVAQTDRGDYDAFNPSSRAAKQLWQDVLADRHACAGAHCVYAGSCYMRVARRRAENSHIVVVNHALLAAHMANPGVLPDFDHVIIDEAHHFSDVVERTFGMELVFADLHRILSEQVARNGLLDHLKFHPDLFGPVEALRDHAVQLQAKMATLERLLLEQTPDSEYNRQAVRVTDELFQQWASGPTESSLVSLRQSVSTVAQISQDIWAAAEALQGDGIKSDPTWLRFQKWAEDMRALSASLEQWGPPRDETVSWWEGQHMDSTPQVTLRHGPVDVAPLVYESLWNRVKTGILTSATLSVAGDFQYMASGLGVPKTRLRAIQLPSPFDLRNNSALAIPQDAPDVSAATYIPALADFLVGLMPVMQGRTLVLTTSHRTLRTLADLLRPRLEEQGILTLAQGIDGPSVKLVEQFKQSPRSVLIGAAGLWEGVDVPGPGLSLVVIARLPFAAPVDPLEEARLERLRARGQSAFYWRTLPQAVLRFQQGFGRLLRTRHDRGIVVVYDTRIIRSRYGSKFIQAVGGTRVEVRPEETLKEYIGQFFTSKGGGGFRGISENTRNE